MLLSLAQWLQGLYPDLGFLRIFQYITFRATMAAMTALLIGLVSLLAGVGLSLLTDRATAVAGGVAACAAVAATSKG